MSFNNQRLYDLLPSIYRIRDAEQGEPLKALLSIIAQEVAILEEDLDQLYDDQFIETCAEWVIPYIGDLIGYRQIHAVSPDVGRKRAEVANTIAYRRRKGTAAVLEQLAEDVTGWKSRVVEFFQLLATTQYMNHLRPDNHYSPDLRHTEVLENVSTPFYRIAHTLDVRNINTNQRRYNIPNIGIFIWRLFAYPVTRGTAKKKNEGRYTFNPLGLDVPLFNPGLSEDDITHMAEPFNVPEPLHTRPLYRELEVLRQDNDRRGLYFGKKPVLKIFRDGTQIPATDILVCDLSDWHLPPDTIPNPKPDEPDEPESFKIQVAIDPVLGRMTFPAESLSDDAVIEVNYSYGFSADMGGGEYPRPYLLAPTLTVSPGGLTLAEALIAASNNSKHIIEIDNSATIDGDLSIELSTGQQLTIQAKDEKRPVINGRIMINSAEDAEVTLDGLLIAGNIQVMGNAPMNLTLRHCTIPPGLTLNDSGTTPHIDWDQEASSGKLTLDHSISGRLCIAEGVRVMISDGIVDARNDTDVALAANEDGTKSAGIVEIIRSTVIGTVYVREITLAENSIFSGRVTSQRRQQGCIRFSCLPSDSLVPRKYYCQPDLAIRQAIDAAMREKPDLSDTEKDRISYDIQSWLKPIFSDQFYGNPGYMQLNQLCPIDIRSGADDGSEMGAFHDLYQIRCETNLKVRLNEYLRFGMEAGIIYVS